MYLKLLIYILPGGMHKSRLKNVCHLHYRHSLTILFSFNQLLKVEKLPFLSKSKTHLDYKLCINYSVIKLIELYSYPAETFHCCRWGEKRFS